MKNILLFLSLTLFISVAFGQITEKEGDLKKQNTDTLDGWKTSGIIGLNFSQLSLQNWSAGGMNSLSLNGLANFQANYSKGKSLWENTLDLGYGILSEGKSDEKITKKTDDKIDFASKFGRKATDKLYYAALLNFKTQFADGFEYPNDSAVISAFMAPAYLVAAIGIDYKPNKDFSAFIAPLTSKTTFVKNEALSNAGAFGVDSSKTVRNEFGGYIKMVYKKDIMKNVNLMTKIDLFSNYIENPEKIDVNWEVLVNLKVNKYITASISTNLLYDDDIKFDKDDDGEIDTDGSLVQFKEVLAIGLSIKF